jgi:multidrug efflux pump subunit AcrB
MEQRVTTSQYSMSTNVTGIKNMEAQTLNGISVQKVYFQSDVNLDLAISQIVAATNAIRAVLPTVCSTMPRAFRYCSSPAVSKSLVTPS